MRLVCPSCQCQFPLEAGLLDAEAKRFGIALAGVDPAVGRALIQYLALHRPQKTALRIAKAAKIVEEIAAIVAAGTVRRNGVQRPAPPAVWAQAMEHVAENRGKLRLPLNSHGYLLEVVAGMADQANASAERQHEADLRVGKRRAGPSDSAPAESPLQQQIAYLRDQLRMGVIDQSRHDAEAEAARIRYGGLS